MNSSADDTTLVTAPSSLCCTSLSAATAAAACCRRIKADILTFCADEAAAEPGQEAAVLQNLIKVAADVLEKRSAAAAGAASLLHSPMPILSGAKLSTDLTQGTSCLRLMAAVCTSHSASTHHVSLRCRPRRPVRRRRDAGAGRCRRRKCAPHGSRCRQPVQQLGQVLQSGGGPAGAPRQRPVLRPRAAEGVCHVP